MAYIVGHPIKNPADFFGRYPQTARFFEIIGGTQAQSLSILGVRRAGKTSFLKHVSHMEVISRYLPAPERFVMIYQDMSACRSPSDFYYRILMQLRKELGTLQTQTNLLKSSPPGQATIYEVELQLCSLSDKRIILLLDEFDHLSTSGFDQSFLTELRSMSGVLDYDLACVTASYLDLYQLGEHLGLPPTSPFYNIFYPTPVFMAGLEDNDIDALICDPARREGVHIDATAVAQIKAIAGTLPFFIQATADLYVHQYRHQQPVDWRSLRNQLVTRMAPYFEQWWRHFSSCEQALLAQAANDMPRPELPYHEVEISDAKRRLRNFGVIHEHADELLLNGELFAAWLAHRQILQEREAEQSQKNGYGRLPLARTRRILSRQFTLEELRTICFDLDVSFDSLPGRGIEAKARDLVDYCYKRGRFEQLLMAIRYERGQIV